MRGLGLAFFRARTGSDKMSNDKASIALAIACLLAAGCAQPGTTASMSGDAMTGDELQALLADGRTLKLGGAGENYAGEVRLEPDGTGLGQATFTDGRIIEISGTWEIDGDRFCREWSVEDYTRVCETWRKLGDNKVAVIVDGERIGVNSW